MLEWGAVWSREKAIIVMQAEISPFDTTPRHIPVDVEHLGIRLLIPFLAIVGLGAGFVLGRIVAVSIDESLGTLCFSVGFAVVGMALMLQLGERVIKPRWSSGRHLTVSTESLTLHDTRGGKQQETAIRWADELTSFPYYWVVGTGKSRVRKGWYCVAVQMRQGDDEVLLYTFLSPENAATLPEFDERFVKLLPRKEREELQKADPREAARQERYRKIEGQRFFDGAELQVEDFHAVMPLIATHSPPAGRK